MRNRPTGFSCWQIAGLAGLFAALLFAGGTTQAQSCSSRSDKAQLSELAKPPSGISQNQLKSAATVKEKSRHATTTSNETVVAPLLPAGFSVPANQLIRDHPSDE